MPGVRLSPQSKRLDVVIEAVRCAADGSRLQLARGYERRGHVWSDLVLFSREELIERLRRGARIVVGRPRDLPGDFEVVAQVRLLRNSGTEVLGAQGERGSGDSLPAPLF
ncbi:MAG: hypothetical protein AB1449_01390 [Chloroflexota bacterium]